MGEQNYDFLKLKVEELKKIAEKALADAKNKIIEEARKLDDGNLFLKD